MGIQDLHAVFAPKKLLLTAAIGAAQGTIDAAYDVEKMYKYLDYVHVMCYDYHGKWDQKTGHNAPLSSRPTESGKDLTLNVEYTLAYLIKKGAKPEKLHSRVHTREKMGSWDTMRSAWKS